MTLPHDAPGPAYMAVPADPPRAAIVVLHAWWGLTPVITSVCDDLAALGYAAIAPDLYDGQRASSSDEANRLRQRRRTTPMWRQIVAAAHHVRETTETGAIGQIGFSMGGHWALWMAGRSRPEIPPFAATAIYYAVRAGDFAASGSAFQFHLAESDPFVSTPGVARQRRALEKAGRPHDIYVYPGTGHWFFEEDRADDYRPAAATLAWERTVAFLEEHLPG